MVDSRWPNAHDFDLEGAAGGTKRGCVTATGGAAEA